MQKGEPKDQVDKSVRRLYKPELPAEIFPGFAARNIKRYFVELALNEDRRCAQCANTRAGRDDA
jgi:hypothetical protein